MRSRLTPISRFLQHGLVGRYARENRTPWPSWVNALLWAGAVALVLSKLWDL
jgi:hypothetical protein